MSVRMLALSLSTLDEGIQYFYMMQKISSGSRLRAAMSDGGVILASFSGASMTFCTGTFNSTSNDLDSDGATHWSLNEDSSA